MSDQLDNLPANEDAEIDAWCQEFGEERLRKATREQLIAEIRALRAIEREDHAARTSLRDPLNSMSYP